MCSGSPHPLLHLSLVLLPRNKQDLQIPPNSPGPQVLVSGFISTPIEELAPLPISRERGDQNVLASTAQQVLSSSTVFPLPELKPVDGSKASWDLLCPLGTTNLLPRWEIFSHLLPGGFHTVAAANRVGKRRLNSGNIPSQLPWGMFVLL